MYWCAFWFYGIAFTKIASASYVCPSRNNGCQDISESISSGMYDRGTCPFHMREGQKCTPKCHNKNAITGGIFQCYHGRIYNNFQCHTKCQHKSILPTTCCFCTCPGIDIDGIYVKSPDTCNCKKLFPKRCRGTVFSRYLLLNSSKRSNEIHNNSKKNNEKKIENNITTIIVFSSLGVLFLFISIICINKYVCNMNNSFLKGKVDVLLLWLNRKFMNNYTSRLNEHRSFVELSSTSNNGSNSNIIIDDDEDLDISYTALT